MTSKIFFDLDTLDEEDIVRPISITDTTNLSTEKISNSNLSIVSFPLIVVGLTFHQKQRHHIS